MTPTYCYHRDTDTVACVESPKALGAVPPTHLPLDPAPGTLHQECMFLTAPLPYLVLHVPQLWFVFSAEGNAR